MGDEQLVDERLQFSQPRLGELLKEAGGEELALKVADMIAGYMGSGKKFVDFIVEFLPSPPEKSCQRFIRLHGMLRI
jgi:hypothetical protein